MRFRLRVHEELSAIEVNIEGPKPRAVLNRLMEHVQTIIGDCMKSLKCFSAVRYSIDGNSGVGSADGLVCNEGAFLIPLSQIESLVESHSVLNRPGGRRLLSESEAMASFSEWLRVKELADQYDVFLSYRWGDRDSVLVRCVYDCFGCHTVGPERRDVLVFLDRECLQDGK